MKIQCAYTELVEIHKLVEHPKNANKHEQNQIDRLAKIIDFQGWRHPIIVSKLSGFVVSGHARLMAAKKLGLDKVPVDYQDFENEAMEYSHLIADNAIAEFYSKTDLAMVNLELPELGPDFDLDMLGIKDFRLEPMDFFEEPKQKEDLKLKETSTQKCPNCGVLIDKIDG
jgi:hypothetical protein